MVLCQLAKGGRTLLFDSSTAGCQCREQTGQDDVALCVRFYSGSESLESNREKFGEWLAESENVHARREVIIG
jgi:hypothetical protein